MSIKEHLQQLKTIKISRLEAAAVSTVAAFFTILLIVTGVAGPWNIIYKTSKIIFSAVPANTNTKAAHIFFAPATLATTAGTHTAYIYVDSGGNKVGEITLKMKYNPKVMQIGSLLPVNYTNQPYDTAFSVKSVSNDIQNGVLTYVINAQARNNNYPLPPVFRAAQLTFTVTGKPSSNVISFLPGTTIYPEVGTAVAGEEAKTAPVSILGSVQPLQQVPAPSLPPQR